MKTGVLECPLKGGFIVFDYSPTDRVSQLRQRIAQKWGEPTSGLPKGDKYYRDLIWPGGFYECNQWVICCEAEDGTYLLLRDEDLIPSIPPPAESEVGDNLIENWSEEQGLDWKGLIHVHDVRDWRDETRRRSIQIRRVSGLPDEHKDADVYLVALVLLSGG